MSGPVFDPLAPLLDPQQWTVVQAAYVAFGKDRPEVRVQLFKSIAPTGSDGVGRPLHSVNLVIAEEGRPLYSFAPPAVPPLDLRRTDSGFYMDDRAVTGCPLELRDVTGDGVPEIMFHSGWMAASDKHTETHVLQYTGDAASMFRDVRAEHFFNSWWWRFRWLDLNGRTLGIVAEPIERSEDPDVACHGCPKFHKYRVYRWDHDKGVFVLSETIPSTRRLHRDDEDPLQTDWMYIVQKLRGRRRQR